MKAVRARGGQETDSRVITASIFCFVAENQLWRLTSTLHLPLENINLLVHVVGPEGADARKYFRQFHNDGHYAAAVANYYKYGVRVETDKPVVRGLNGMPLGYLPIAINTPPEQPPAAVEIAHQTAKQTDAHVQESPVNASKETSASSSAEEIVAKGSWLLMSKSKLPSAARRPSAIVCDMFVSAEDDIRELLREGRLTSQIPCYSFWPSNAVCLATDFMKNTLELSGLQDGEVLNWSHIAFDKRGDDNHMKEFYDLVVKAKLKRDARDGLLLNDVSALYPFETVEDLRLIVGEDQDIHYVGPLTRTPGVYFSPSGKDLENSMDLFEQVAGSGLVHRVRRDEGLVFISLGSNYLFPDQGQALLEALLQELSKRYCVIMSDARRKEPIRQNNIYISNWIDQRRVLRSPDLKLFITHGGWNGLLEAMTLNTAPVMVLPLGAEQPLNGVCVEKIYRNGILLSDISQLTIETADHVIRHRDFKTNAESLYRKTLESYDHHAPQAISTLR